tara:strand:- start:294 stop:509 length:216 start_codon:yes stop_codon:yes gene_type:complete
MEMNNPIILKVTDITWETPKDIKKDLPKELELKWNSKDWNDTQVSHWLSEYFKVQVNNLKIKKLVNKTSSG